MELIIILGVLAFLLQVFAAWFAYRIWKFDRLSAWWLALVLAFLIQGVRRLLTLLEDSSQFSFGSSVLFDRALSVVISLLIAIGLFAMLKRFESFEIISKEAGRVVKKINQNGRKRGAV